MTGSAMSGVRNISRVLTLKGWGAVLVLAAAALLLLGFLGRGLGVRWDPFGLEQRSLVAAQTKAARMGAEVEALRAEAAGRERQVVRDRRHQEDIEAMRRVTAEAATAARASHDANEILDDARLERMRAHDRELCRIAPDLDGCAAEAGSGRQRARAMSSDADA